MVKEHTRYTRKIGNREIRLVVDTIFPYCGEDSDWKPVETCHCLKNGKCVYMESSVIEKFYTEEETRN